MKDIASERRRYFLFARQGRALMGESPEHA